MDRKRIHKETALDVIVPGRLSQKMAHVFEASNAQEDANSNRVYSQLEESLTLVWDTVWDKIPKNLVGKTFDFLTYLTFPLGVISALKGDYVGATVLPSAGLLTRYVAGLYCNVGLDKQNQNR